MSDEESSCGENEVRALSQLTGWKFALAWVGFHPFLTIVVVALICCACNGGCK